MSARDSESGRASENIGRTKPGQDESSATFGAFVRKPGARRVAGDVSGSNKGSDKGSLQPEAAIERVEALPEDAVEVGFIADAYGLKGWVKIVPHANGKQGGDALLSAKRWWLVKGRDRKSARCLQSKVHADTIVARLAGCDDRDAALALKGHTVNIARGDFPKLDSD